MRRSLSMISLAATISLCAFSVGCDRRTVPAIGDAATTGAPVSIEPVAHDASTTSATLPVEQRLREQPPLAPAREAGATPVMAAATDADAAALPRWVPRDATLSIIASGDRDRNLGIASPAGSPPKAPSKLTVDAGGVAVDIEIYSRP